jgi:hypothetical protein
MLGHRGAIAVKRALAARRARLENRPTNHGARGGPMNFHGRCLCGAVTYQATGAPAFVANCYCADCRRESGGGHITAVAVPAGSLTTTGETGAYVKPAESGQTIRNTFCPVCATTLYTHPSRLPHLALIRAGTLDDSQEVRPRFNLYVESALDWDRPPAGLTDFPGMAP